MIKKLALILGLIISIWWLFLFLAYHSLTLVSLIEVLMIGRVILLTVMVALKFNLVG